VTQEAIKWSNITLKTWKVNTFNKEAIMCIFWSGTLELTKKYIGRLYEYLKKVGEKTLYEMKCAYKLWKT
jgi:hypothetical protein